LGSKPFVIGATNTLYYVSASVLADVLQAIPSNVLTNNLLAEGFDRFFFEGLFPSMLLQFAAHIQFLSDPYYEEGLPHTVSFDLYPFHNSKMVEDEFARYQKMGQSYFQIPRPYVFGGADALSSVKIVYGT
jgi:hypothetical protein